MFYITIHYQTLRIRCLFLKILGPLANLNMCWTLYMYLYNYAHNLPLNLYHQITSVVQWLSLLLLTCKRRVGGSNPIVGKNFCSVIPACFAFVTARLSREAEAFYRSRTVSIAIYLSLYHYGYRALVIKGVDFYTFRIWIFWSIIVSF